MLGKSRIFELNGYDPFLDYVKGICIFFVILAHNLPQQDLFLFPFCGDQAVPCFLLIQVFHVYKRGININSKIDVRKIFKRIILPFLVVSMVSAFLLYVTSDLSFMQVLEKGLAAGGYGPGSYYIWVYLQFVLLIPLCRYIFIYASGYKLLAIFVLISVLIELLCSHFHPSAIIYILLFLRYFFLIYLGYMLTVEKVNTIELLLLNVLSLVFIFLFYYSECDFEPFFFDNDWKIFHWIIYFYTASGFLYILRVSYHLAPAKLLKLVKCMGTYSYEIFLSQMFVFAFLRPDYLSFLKNWHINIGLIYISLTIILSIFPILIYKGYKR